MALGLIKLCYEGRESLSKKESRPIPRGPGVSSFYICLKPDHILNVKKVRPIRSTILARKVPCEEVGIPPFEFHSLRELILRHKAELIAEVAATLPSFISQRAWAIVPCIRPRIQPVMVSLGLKFKFVSWFHTENQCKLA